MTDERPESAPSGIRPLTLLGDPAAVACEGDACLIPTPTTSVTPAP